MGLLTFFLGIIMFALLLVLILYVVNAIGLWKMFAKSGEPGWSGLIPFYNLYVLCKITGVNPWWVLIIFLSPILDAIPVIGPLAQVAAMLYFRVLLAVSVSRSYGKDDSFAIGLFFLSPIFYLILGFGSAEYVGAKPMDDFVFGTKADDSKGESSVDNSSKFCTSCGAKLDLSAKFCPYCGKESK